ncbi:putative quinol monooxygenase [Promicromonospora panici]|uniref:putative quinol monooxygenase n=1 Tax=Promicromonospora panici TaxID=2219658 RepID=UPI00101CE0BE|nr:hypothetical protein [Promicromonospora panici]
MLIAKLVRAHVDENQVGALDDLLAASAVSFAEEPGTVFWRHFVGESAQDRVIIEVFADRRALAEHDASARVERLLQDLGELEVTVLTSEEFESPGGSSRSVQALDGAWRKT